MILNSFPSSHDSLAPENAILEHGLELIVQLGIKGFTVETLAKDLGMSKKTIYKYFPSREILLQRIFHYITTLLAEHFKQVLNRDNNPLDKFLSAVDEVINTLNRVSITRIVELKARYPLIWMQIERFRLERREDFLAILSQARTAGYIRDEIDLELTATLLMNIINEVFQPEFFIRNQLNPKDVLLGFRNIFLRGIITPTGLEYLENHA